MRCSFPVISVILRFATTISPGSLSALSRQDRRNYLAGIERGYGRPDKAWAGGRQRRRLGKDELQEKPARGRRNRQGGRPCAQGFRRPLRNHRFFTLRLRRATVLLSRFQSPDGFADENAVGPLSRISYVGGQPQSGSAQVSG